MVYHMTPGWFFRGRTFPVGSRACEFVARCAMFNLAWHATLTFVFVLLSDPFDLEEGRSLRWKPRGIVMRLPTAETTYVSELTASTSTRSRTRGVSLLLITTNLWQENNQETPTIITALFLCGLPVY